MAPEAGESAVVRVGGHEGDLGPCLVEVVEDDDGLEDRAAAVEEDGDLLVDGVVEEEGGALFGEVLLRVLEVEAFEPEGELDSVSVGARP